VKKLWIALHKYVGLAAGLVIALICLTGSILVFDHALDESLNSDLLRSTHVENVDLDWDALFDRAKAFCGVKGLELTSLSAPRKPGVSAIGFCEKGDETVTVYFDPKTTEVLGTRGPNHLLSVIYDLHYSLVSGRRGAIAVGLIGIVFLFQIITGIYLSLPTMTKKRLVTAFGIKTRYGKARLWLDLHRAPGLYVSIVALIVTFSGVYMTFPAPFQQAIRFSASEERQAVHAHNLPDTAEQNAAALPISAGISNVRNMLHEFEVNRISFSAEDRNPYQLTVRLAGEPRKSGGRTRIWVDRSSQRIVSVESYFEEPAARKFGTWMFILHNGEAFGLVGRWIVLFSGLIGTLLFISGLWYWMIKRQGRR